MLHNLKNYLILTAHEDEKGIYYSTKKGIYASLNDGTEVNMYELLTMTRYFWLYEFYALGIRDTKPVEPDFTIPKPPRESESGTGNMNLIAMEGHSFNLKIKRFVESPELAKRLSVKKENNLPDIQGQ